MLVLAHPGSASRPAASSRAGRPARSSVPRSPPIRSGAASGVPWEQQAAPGAVAGVGMRVEMDDPQASRRHRLGHGAGGRVGDRVVATEHDRDRPRSAPPRATCARITACPRSRSAGHDRGVPAVDDVEPVERLDPELERVGRAGVVEATRIARGPKRAPGRWLTPSSSGAPTIDDVRPSRAQRVAVDDRGASGRSCCRRRTGG